MTRNVMKKYLIILALATLGSSFLAPGLLGLLGWADDQSPTLQTSDSPPATGQALSAGVAASQQRPTVLTPQAPKPRPARPATP